MCDLMCDEDAITEGDIKTKVTCEFMSKYLKLCEEHERFIVNHGDIFLVLDTTNKFVSLKCPDRTVSRVLENILEFHADEKDITHKFKERVIFKVSKLRERITDKVLEKISPFVWPVG